MTSQWLEPASLADHPFSLWFDSRYSSIIALLDLVLYVASLRFLKQVGASLPYAVPNNLNFRALRQISQWPDRAREWPDVWNFEAC
jgi:hypothetical protein